MFHYTDVTGFDAIRSQVDWTFRAEKPPGNHPVGAYFTTLPPGTKNLSKRLFLRGGGEKTQFVFAFVGDEGLEKLPGGRGNFIRYSKEDYLVVKSRHEFHGKADEWQEAES